MSTIGEYRFISSVSKEHWTIISVEHCSGIHYSTSKNFKLFRYEIACFLNLQ